MKSFRTFLSEETDKKNKAPKYYDTFVGNVSKLERKSDDDLYHDVFIGNVEKLEKDDIDPNQGKLNIEEAVVPGWKKTPVIYNELNEPSIHWGDNEEDFDPKRHDYMMNPVQAETRLDNAIKPTGNFQAVNDYTGASYKRWNKSLMGLPVDAYSWDPDQEKTDKMGIDGLKQEISKRVTKSDETLYTGIKYHPWEHPVVDGLIHVRNPAFTSLSTRYTVAQSFPKEVPAIHPDGEQMQLAYRNDHGDVIARNAIPKARNILRVHIPSGSHGVYVESKSANPGEYEMILHPGARLHINPRPQIRRHPYENDQLMHIWDAHLVHDGVDKPYKPHEDERQLAFNFGD